MDPVRRQVTRKSTIIRNKSKPLVPSSKNHQPMTYVTINVRTNRTGSVNFSFKFYYGKYDLSSLEWQSVYGNSN